jgi:hypothetical protein
MAEYRAVDDAIARFDALIERYDGAPRSRAAGPRQVRRSARSVARRITNIGMAIAALIVATIGFGLIVGPIGLTGLFAIAIATLFILIFFSVWPGEKPERPFTESMANRDVVSRLDTYLGRRRTALPAPAARKVDAISAQLPLLESRLGEVDALDPLAQDARRLMGKHLPDLIDHYQRVPVAYRGERDSAGLTVDERLVAGLDAAKEALDDIGARLAKDDLAAFETQGRFIESRYKDGSGFKDGGSAS